MTVLASHALLFGALFIAGLMFGFLMMWALIASGKMRF